MELRRRRAHPSVSMTIQPLASSPSLTALARTDSPEPTAPRAAVAPPKSGDGYALGPDPASAFSRFADAELWGKKKPKAKPSATQPASKPAVKAVAAPSPTDVAETKRTETMKQIKTEFGLGELPQGLMEIGRLKTFGQQRLPEAQAAVARRTLEPQRIHHTLHTQEASVLQVIEKGVELRRALGMGPQFALQFEPGMFPCRQQFQRTRPEAGAAGRPLLCQPAFRGEL